MSTQIVKFSISLAAIATSVVFLFAVAWIGLAVLGY